LSRHDASSRRRTPLLLDQALPLRRDVAFFHYNDTPPARPAESLPRKNALLRSGVGPRSLFAHVSGTHTFTVRALPRMV